MFGAWVSPCCLEPILLEQGVGDDELMSTIRAVGKEKPCSDGEEANTTGTKWYWKSQTQLYM